MSPFKTLVLVLQARKQLREKDVTIIEMERKVSELVEELTDKTTTFERSVCTII